MQRASLHFKRSVINNHEVCEAWKLLFGMFSTSKDSAFQGAEYPTTRLIDSSLDREQGRSLFPLSSNYSFLPSSSTTMETPKLNRRRCGAVQYQGRQQTELPKEHRTLTHAASHPSRNTASYESFPNIEPSPETPQALGLKKTHFETRSRRPRHHQKQKKAQAHKRAE